jgi:SOS response regulatory protein OraA/RecX
MKDPLKRITKVLEYYQRRGYNSERINKIYRKILKNIKSNAL